MEGLKDRLRDWLSDQSINFTDKPLSDVEITVNAVRVRETGQIFFLGELDNVLIAVSDGQATVELDGQIIHPYDLK